jgi:hypothetical protein
VVDNRSGVLEHTKLSWTHIVHAEVVGVTDGRYWVGTNPTTGGGIVSKKKPNFRFPRDMLSPTPREDVPCTILQLDTRGQLSEVDDDTLLLEAPATVLLLSKVADAAAVPS